MSKAFHGEDSKDVTLNGSQCRLEVFIDGIDNGHGGMKYNVIAWVVNAQRSAINCGAAAYSKCGPSYYPNDGDLSAPAPVQADQSGAAKFNVEVRWSLEWGAPEAYGTVTDDSGNEVVAVAVAKVVQPAMAGLF